MATNFDAVHFNCLYWNTVNLNVKQFFLFIFVLIFFNALILFKETFCQMNVFSILVKDDFYDMNALTIQLEVMFDVY